MKGPSSLLHVLTELLSPYWVLSSRLDSGYPGLVSGPLAPTAWQGEACHHDGGRGDATREAGTVLSQADDGGHTFICLISFSPHSHLGEDEPCAHFTGVSLEVPRVQQPSLDHRAGTDLSGSISTPPSVS